jgi:hypothetical protein
MTQKHAFTQRTVESFLEGGFCREIVQLHDHCNCQIADIGSLDVTFTL